MNSNPEFPISNQSAKERVGHSGHLDPSMREVPVVPGLPDLTEEVVENTVPGDTVHENFGGEQVTLSPAEKAEFDQYRRSIAAGRETAQPTNEVAQFAVDKQKGISKKGIIAGIAGLALAAGAAIGLNANAQSNTLPPAPVETSAAANPNVNTTPTQSEASASPSASGEMNIATPVENYIYYSADGTSKTHDEVVAEVKVSPDEHKNVTDVMNTIFKRVELAMNYLPDEKTVRDNLKIPNGPLDINHYQVVGEQYQAITLDTLLRGKGDLYDTFKAIGKDTLYEHLITWGAGESEPYKISITQNFIKNEEIDVTDNSPLNSVGDYASRNVGKYKIKSTGGGDLSVPQVPADEDKNTYQPTWQLAGNIGMTKIDAK